MSVWTHVHGIVRIRTYNDSMKKVKKDIAFIKEILGPQESDFKTEEEVKYGMGKITLPGGSEGWLGYDIANITLVKIDHEYDEEAQKWTGKTIYTTVPDQLIITFFGDLRDMGLPNEKHNNYDYTTEDLDKWFNDFIEKLQKENHYLDIRGATLIYECEESNTGWMLKAIDGPEFGAPMVVVKQMVPKDDQLRLPWHEESKRRK